MIEIKNILDASIQDVMEASTNPNNFVGIPTGLKELDRLLYGLDNSDLIVVGGRPGMGKTAFLISLAINMAMKEIPVMFYSLQMDNNQITKRIISNVSSIDVDKIKSGLLSNEDWDKLNQACQVLYKLPIFLSDKIDWKIEDFCNQVKKDIEENKANIIIIDYLQLFSSREKLQNRYEEIALCTRELKKLARELNIPIIVASQLNRNVESRNSNSLRDSIPQMYDLRDSGTICEDANVIILLHRPEYYLQSAEDDRGNNIRGLAEVFIAKNHMGETGCVRLNYIKGIGKFENWEDHHVQVSSFINTSEFDNIDPSF